MRLKTPVVKISNCQIGGQNPIVIQSMTNTDTADHAATVAQCIELAEAGAEMVRITVDNLSAAQAVPRIRQLLDRAGHRHLPLIGDFHFNGHRLLSEVPECAKTLDKYRINPGNVGFGRFHDENFEAIVRLAVHHKKPVRIGVNGGSLDPDLLKKFMDRNARLKKPLSDRKVFIEAMVESALSSAKLAEKIGLKRNQIILSVKMSELLEMVAAYRLLAARMKKTKHVYALHLGLTEAGQSIQGITSSAAALAILLQEGIGDTIRVSLTPKTSAHRTEEVEVCKYLLQSLGLRHFRPRIVSCPGCGRSSNDLFQKIAGQVQSHITKNQKKWLKKYPCFTTLKIAVMGCVVNGPGESRTADIALSLPGKMEKNMAAVYINGKFSQNLKEPNIATKFFKIIESYLQNENI